jgi:hypothetical protein
MKKEKINKTKSPNTAKKQNMAGETLVNEIVKLNPERQCSAKVFFALFLSALIATFLWVYYLSLGFSQPGILDAFIDIQAYALQNGRIAITPDYHHIFYHDVSLYKGNYYFYWGILPSALHAFLSMLLSRTISSYLISFLFLFLFVYFFQRIVFEIINTATHESSLQTGFITCATIILSWILIFSLPLPYSVYHDSWFFGHFAIYEQQIMFGLGLAMPGLFCLIKGQKENKPNFLITAACLFAAAAWVRGTWFVFSVLTIPVVFVMLLMKKRFRSLLKWPHYAFMMVPVLLTGGLLALNFARFGSIFEFGLKLQNPVFSFFLRIQNGLFSPVTQFFNTTYKILAYYTSPGLIQLSGVWEKSSSWSEDLVEPYLFYNNPLLLFLVPVVLYGIYRALRVNRNMRGIIIIVGATALIINGLIVFMGNIVTMRYFVECYYLTMLLVLAGLMVVLPVKISFPVLVVLLSIHLPGNIKAFLETNPELRLIKIVESKQDRVDYKNISPARTFFIYKDARWHEGIISASQKETFTNYNTIGMITLQNGMISADDLTAVYIKPKKMKGFSENRAFLEFIGIKSVGKPGRIRVYMEKTKVAEFSIVPDEARTYRTEIDYDLKDDAPCRLLIYFFEENTSYLPAKQGNQHAFLFEAIRLSPTIEDFNKAIQLKPDYANAYNNRGIVYLNQGDNISGCLDARKACELGNCKLLEAVNTKGLCR